MSINANMIRFPPRRYEQLKVLAAHLGLSISDTVAYLVRKESAARSLPADIPGIAIQRAGNDLSVTVDANPTASFDLASAVELARSLRDVASGALYDFKPTRGYSVARQGNGIRVAIPFGSTAIMLSPELARDLADLIEKATN